MTGHGMLQSLHAPSSVANRIGRRRVMRGLGGVRMRTAASHPCMLHRAALHSCFELGVCVQNSVAKQPGHRARDQDRGLILLQTLSEPAGVVFVVLGRGMLRSMRVLGSAV